MLTLAPLALALLAAPAALPGRVDPPAAPAVTVAVDSGRKEITITAGPFAIENMGAMDHHGGMMNHAGSEDVPVQAFAWPVEGWFRGFRWELVDSKGRPLPKKLMHHLIMVNFDRRQAIYNAVERLMGAGSETEDAVVPKTIGVPLSPGMRLGMYIAWMNDTGKDLEDVHLKLTMMWTPKNQNPRPVSTLPLYADVNLTVGGGNTYEVPVGRSEKSYEFTVPVSGKMLAVGGHLHDYGSSVRLEDVESGKVLAQVQAKRTPDGRVLGVGRKLFGVTGDGFALKAGRTYRVVGVYDNPTGKPQPGAMASMVGLFAPDDMTKWPAVDTSTPDMKRDLISLKVMEGDDEEGGHDHGAHNHNDGGHKH